MFCPECRAEYREGFNKCSDCNVDLVEQLPPEQEEVFPEYVKVLKIGNPSDIAMVKSILDSENITYYLQGEHINYIIPPVLPAILMVRKDQVMKTVEILTDLQLSFDIIDQDPESEKD